MSSGQAKVIFLGTAKDVQTGARGLIRSYNPAARLQIAIVVAGLEATLGYSSIIIDRIVTVLIGTHAPKVVSFVVWSWCNLLLSLNQIGHQVRILVEL